MPYPCLKPGLRARFVSAWWFLQHSWLGPHFAALGARRSPAAGGSLVSEQWQEAPRGRENALLHSLGELRLPWFTAIADELCCSRNRGSSKPSVPAALGQSLFMRKRTPCPKVLTPNPVFEGMAPQLLAVGQRHLAAPAALCPL